MTTLTLSAKDVRKGDILVDDTHPVQQIRRAGGATYLWCGPTEDSVLGLGADHVLRNGDVVQLVRIVDSRPLDLTLSTPQILLRVFAALTRQMEQAETHKDHRDASALRARRDVVEAELLRRMSVG
jgi:hypothetical protein